MYEHSLSFYSTVVIHLKQQAAGRQVAPLGHIILILSNLSLLFPLNTACLVEKQQILIATTTHAIGANHH
jgi:hypothetical protein